MRAFAQRRRSRDHWCCRCALRRYAIKGGEKEWDSALGGGKLQGNVSIKSADGGSSKKRKVVHDHDGSRYEKKEKKEKKKKKKRKSKKSV